MNVTTERLAAATKAAGQLVDASNTVIWYARHWGESAHLWTEPIQLESAADHAPGIADLDDEAATELLAKSRERLALVDESIKDCRARLDCHLILAVQAFCQSFFDNVARVMDVARPLQRAADGIAVHGTMEAPSWHELAVKHAKRIHRKVFDLFSAPTPTLELDMDRLINGCAEAAKALSGFDPLPQQKLLVHLQREAAKAEKEQNTESGDGDDERFIRASDACKLFPDEFPSGTNDVKRYAEQRGIKTRKPITRSTGKPARNRLDVDLIGLARSLAKDKGENQQQPEQGVVERYTELRRRRDANAREK
jgi:hypothetical protein